MDATLIVDTTISAIDMSPDMRETTEILAAADGLVARITAFIGHTREGGGMMDVSSASSRCSTAADPRCGRCRDATTPSTKCAKPVRTSGAARKDRAHRGRARRHRATTGLDARWREAPVENAIGQVVVLRDGLFASLEVFDIDDEAGMLARLAELAGGTQVAPGVDPAHPMVAVCRATFEAANRRDWDAFAALFADDYQALDHRRVGWAPVEGVDGIVHLLRSAFSGVDDARLAGAVFAVADGLALRSMSFAGHAPQGGGAFVHEHITITMAPAGLIVREEHFEAEDLPAARQRFEELRAARDGMTPAERAHAERAGDAFFESVAAAPRVSAAWVGPEREGQVAVLGADGLVASVETFAADDERGMLARFEILRADGELTPVERWLGSYFERLCTDDWSGLGELVTDDYTHVDRRPLGMDTTRGREAFVAIHTGWNGVIEGVRTAVLLRVYAQDERAAALHFVAYGEARVGGGEIRADFPVLLVLDRGRLCRTENFAHGEEALARFEELRVSATAPA